MLCCIIITDTVIPRLAHCRSEHRPVILSEAKNLVQDIFSVILSKAKNLMSETLRREPVWCARSFTPPDGFVQEDKRTASSMVTRNGFVYGDKGRHRYKSSRQKTLSLCREQLSLYVPH